MGRESEASIRLQARRQTLEPAKPCRHRHMREKGKRENDIKLGCRGGFLRHGRGWKDVDPEIGDEVHGLSMDITCDDRRTRGSGGKVSCHAAIAAGEFQERERCIDRPQVRDQSTQPARSRGTVFEILGYRNLFVYSLVIRWAAGVCMHRWTAFRIRWQPVGRPFVFGIARL